MSDEITKITKKIVSQKVVKSEESINSSSKKYIEKNNISYIHERLERPDTLIGSTYKLSTPLFPHSLYITINDILLNEGTEDEVRLPFELFINSKNIENFEWVVALTRLISAVFRKGGDTTFMVEELKSVFNPKAGYYKKGVGFIPSCVAEIGYVIEKHMQNLGMFEAKQVPNKTPYNEEITSPYSAKEPNQAYSEIPHESLETEINGELCVHCFANAVVLQANCMTCLNCGESKCD